MSDPMEKHLVVIGAGISGLATGYRLKKMLNDRGLCYNLSILEADDRVGGKIRTERDQGFLCEWSSNGFLNNKPQTLELCHDLGLDERLLPSNDAARKRFIFSGGRLHQLPSSPFEFFKSPLLSWPGKLRIMIEPFIKKNTSIPDETLARFATRRLGREVYEKLLDPMVSGIFAGNPETMSLRAAFPRIYQLEQEYGSLIRAMIKIGKEGKKNNQEATTKAGPAGPGGILTSFSDGLTVLPETLATELADKIHLNSTVIALTRVSHRFHLCVEDRAKQRRELVADHCFFAIPSYCLVDIFKDSAADLSSILAKTPYSAVTVLHLGYHQAELEQIPNGFGFLIPHNEKRKILGALFASSIFQHRAERNKTLLTAIVGGARNGELAMLEDDRLIAMVKQELFTLLGIDTTPCFVKSFCHPKAIPQYLVGHLDNLGAAEEIIGSRFPGIYLTGNAFRGIGLNDCVASAETIVTRFADHLDRYIPHRS